MATVYDLNVAWDALQNAEGRVGAVWRKALFLYERGRLTEDGRAMFHALRDDLHATEMRAYTFLTTALRDIPGSEASGMVAAVPVPLKYPDLPPLPTGTRGLGAAPVVVVAAPAAALNPWALAAAVIIALGIIGAIAYVLVEYGDDIRAIMEFSTATSEAGRRYDDCISRGISMEECQRAHPGPTPRSSDSGLSWYIWAGLGVGAAAVIGIGVYAYVKKKQVGAAFGAYKAAGTSQLSGPKAGKSDAFKFALPSQGDG